MHNPIVTDLSFGDTGKGTIVDYLATPRSVVVRYNGGGQAAHNVVRDGLHHTFAQFGSGTFVGARTHLSRFMLVNPLAMIRESAHLAGMGFHPHLRTTIDPRALIVTPFHIAVNRLREISRADARHGSTGHGIGECRRDSLVLGRVLQAGDLRDPVFCRLVLLQTQRRMQEEAAPLYARILRDHVVGARWMQAAEAEWDLLHSKVDARYDSLVTRYSRWAGQVTFRDDSWLAEHDGDLIFEGAQGVLLDETHGFAPHNTWTDCTPNNARTLLADVGLSGAVVGVTRTYMTRHGAGPFPTENEPMAHDEAHNALGEYQGSWRTGALDIPLLRYAVSCCDGVDVLAVTHLDVIPADAGTPVCTQYVLDGGVFDRLEDKNRIWDVTPYYKNWWGTSGAYAVSMSEMLDVPLAITSFGPSSADKNVCAIV